MYHVSAYLFSGAMFAEDFILQSGRVSVPSHPAWPRGRVCTPDLQQLRGNGLVVCPV